MERVRFPYAYPGAGTQPPSSLTLFKDPRRNLNETKERILAFYFTLYAKIELYLSKFGNIFRFKLMLVVLMGLNTLNFDSGLQFHFTSINLV